MKHITFFIIFFLLMIESYAQLTIDDLEDIGPNCSVVTTRIIDGVTVTITTQGGYPMLANTYNDSTCLAFSGADDEPNTPLNPGNVSGTRFISHSNYPNNLGFPQAQPIIFLFNQPVTFFGLTTLDLCENNDLGAELKLQAFDNSNNLIDEHIRTGPQGPSGLDLDWSVSSNGIVKVLLTGTISLDYPGYGIDDLILIDSSATGIEFQETIKPTHITLHQNYPNPFNPITKIKYSIPNSEIVQIKVIDILGNEIKTLINEYKLAGIYEIEFDARGLPSGVYFYRMISGSYAEIKKMIVLR